MRRRLIGGRKEGAKTCLIAASPPHITKNMLIAAQLICFFSLGSNQQTNNLHAYSLQQRCDIRKTRKNAAAVLLGRKGTNVSLAVWGIRSAAAVTTAAALGLGSKTVMIAPCHLVTTLVAVTHQHQHHLHHQHQHHYYRYRQQSKNWF